jgi:hypothetical protein
MFRAMRHLLLTGRAVVVLCLSVQSAWLAGCASSAKATLDPAFQPPPGTMVRMGPVVESSSAQGHDTIEVDIADEMRQALQQSLAGAGLLAAAGSTGPAVELATRIEGYAPGSAVGGRYLRNLFATKLKVECTLRDQGRDVGTIVSDREVKGGLRTGEERSEVFSDVASDIVAQLESRLR